jgi:transcriptional regulator of acetoin/glycerol metabolism
LRVVLVGEGSGLEELVKRMVGGKAELVAFVPKAEHVEADLVVVDAEHANAKVLAQVREAYPEAPLIVVSTSSPASARLRLQLTPADLARLTYRQVVDRFGREVVADFVVALLRKHEGNVTKAALAAGLERESLHRLMRRYRLRADGFRSPGAG